MADFKMRTDLVAFTKLNVMQYSFESIHGDKKEFNRRLFEKAAPFMPVIQMKPTTYYRARIISDNDGEETGIKRKDGYPISGYNVQYSGVAPADKTPIGRVNHKCEQVLYLAEDADTAIKENKPNDTIYLSVAECKIKNELSIVDFSFTVDSGLDKIFSEQVFQKFADEYSIDIRALYMMVGVYLTSPSFKDVGYAASLDFLDLIKTKMAVSGIIYTSYFTRKRNLALWDDNKFLLCENSKVVKYCAEK